MWSLLSAISGFVFIIPDCHLVSPGGGWDNPLGQNIFDNVAMHICQPEAPSLVFKG